MLHFIILSPQLCFVMFYVFYLVTATAIVLLNILLRNLSSHIKSYSIIGLLNILQVGTQIFSGGKNYTKKKQFCGLYKSVLLLRIVQRTCVGPIFRKKKFNISLIFFGGGGFFFIPLKTLRGGPPIFVIFWKIHLNFLRGKK